MRVISKKGFRVSHYDLPLKWSIPICHKHHEQKNTWHVYQKQFGWGLWVKIQSPTIYIYIYTCCLCYIYNIYIYIANTIIFIHHVYLLYSQTWSSRLQAPFRGNMNPPCPAGTDPWPVMASFSIQFSGSKNNNEQKTLKSLKHRQKTSIVFFRSIVRRKNTI